MIKKEILNPFDVLVALRQKACPGIVSGTPEWGQQPNWVGLANYSLKDPVICKFIVGHAVCCWITLDV